MPTRREEVYNVHLAGVLTERGMGSFAGGVGEWLGVSFVIEAKYDGDAARSELERQLGSRLRAGYGTLGVAVGWPESWRTADDPPPQRLTRSPFAARLQLADGRATSWADVSGVDGLLALLTSGRDLLVAEDRLASSVQRLRDAVTTLARAFATQPGRASGLLRVVTPDAATRPTPHAVEAAGRVAALMVCTALLLQEALSLRDAHVPAVPRPANLSAIQASWTTILVHDYRSVFASALDVLASFASDASLDAVLADVAETMCEVRASGVLDRHDLVGRVYHTLLADQKFLATFYTSVPAATLLADLAVRSFGDVDWSDDPEDLGFRIGDPSCGTGTLLLAGLTAARSAYLRGRVGAHRPADLAAFSQRMIERGIVGYDILAYAIQVCAATLLLSGCSTFRGGAPVQLLPYGGPDASLGSLEFLMRGAAAPEPVDLVLMNPPFTRSQGGSRMLGSLPPEEFDRARAKLADLGSVGEIGTGAGLGALFLPIADRMLRVGGRLAFVLPKTFLTGKQWQGARAWLAAGYAVETVIVSHEAAQWNFSDSTSLSEVMVIARKREGPATEERMRWVNLTANPDTAVEALGVAAAIGVGEGRLRVGSIEIGEVDRSPCPTDGRPWSGAQFSHRELRRCGAAIESGEPLTWSRLRHPAALPLCRLGEIGRIGYDRRDITDAFELSPSAAGYPAVWGTDADACTSLRAPAVVQLRPRETPASGRTRIKPAGPVWEGAGALLVAERLRLTTMRTPALVADERVLSNTFWTLAVEAVLARRLAVWMNSTLGLITWIQHADETEGPWMAVKKHRLATLPVLDPREATALDAAWALCDSPFLPISQASEDRVRAGLDEAVERALSLPEGAISPLRHLLSSEARFREAGSPRVRTVGSQLPLFG